MEALHRLVDLQIPSLFDLLTVPGGYPVPHQVEARNYGVEAKKAVGELRLRHRDASASYLAHCTRLAMLPAMGSSVAFGIDEMVSLTSLLLNDLVGFSRIGKERVPLVRSGGAEVRALEGITVIHGVGLRFPLFRRDCLGRKD